MARALKAALLGFAIAIFLSFGNAQAQPACAPIEQIERFAAEYKEMPVSFGKAEGGWTLVIFVAESGKTWTAIMVSPDGRMGCTIPGVHGTGWVPGVLAGKGV